jgi:hypothetical protein
VLVLNDNVVLIMKIFNEKRSGEKRTRQDTNALAEANKVPDICVVTCGRV